MAQRALRGLPASQAPTCGLAACAHLARHTYLPRQKVPSASLTSPIPVLMPLIPSHRQRHRGALTSPSRTARKVGRSGLLPMHRRDAGAPGPPDRARAEQGRGLGREEVPERALQGVGRAEAKASRTKPTSGVGSKGSPRGQGKACGAAGGGKPGPAELTVPWFPSSSPGLRSSVPLTSLSRPCQSCPGSGLPRPLA